VIGALRGLASVAARNSARVSVRGLDDAMIGLGRKANRGRQRLKWAAIKPEKFDDEIKKAEQQLRELTHTKGGKPRATISPELQSKIDEAKNRIQKLRDQKQAALDRISFMKDGSIRGWKLGEDGTVRKNGRIVPPSSIPDEIKEAYKKQQNFARGTGYGVTEAGMFGAPIAAGLALSPVRSVREYITQDNFEDNLSRQMLPQQMGAMVMSREQNRMRQIQSNLKRLASADPQIAAALMAGRHLPQNASVFGGQPRTDLMMALGEAMEQGRTAAPPDPLLEMM